MNIYLAKRHWAGNEAGVETLERETDRLATARELALTKGYPIHFSVRISHPASLDPELQARVEKAGGQFLKGSVDFVHNRNNASAGSKYVGQAFRKSGLGGVAGVACLDQFVLHTEEGLEAFYDLCQRMEAEDTLYATGSRSSMSGDSGYRVRLAPRDTPNAMRRIHELFMSAVGAKINFAVPPERTPTHFSDRAYIEFGEASSGMHLIRRDHRAFRDLQGEVLGNPDFVKGGFQLDYFAAMWTGLRELISTGYVLADANEFPEPTNTFSAEVEWAIAKIRAPTELLARTSVADGLRASLRSREIDLALRKHFDKQVVDEVRNIMLDAF